MTSSADYYIDTPDAPQPSSLNNKIMVAAIVVLFCVIIFLTSLHIIAKWVWRSHSRNSNTIRFYTADQDSSATRNGIGLSKAAIAQLPTFTYTAPAISNPGTDEAAGLLECAVCLSEFQENEEGRLLPSCKHSFHIECIDMWFYSHSTCPLCRAKVMPTITTSPLMPITVTTQYDEQQQTAGEGEAHIAIDTTWPSAHDDNLVTAPATPERLDLSHAVQIPTNVLFTGNSTELLQSQLDSSQSSVRPSPSSSAKATRCMPHITVEIPTRQDNTLTSPGCLSLPSRRSRCTTPHGAGSSSRTPLKSPGLRTSIKRMLNGHSSEGIHKL